MCIKGKMLFHYTLHIWHVEHPVNGLIRFYDKVEESEETGPLYLCTDVGAAAIESAESHITLTHDYSIEDLVEKDRNVF